MDEKKTLTATMTLPKNGAKLWTKIMQCDEYTAPKDLEVGAPIVMAVARFEDGVWVAGGVLKSKQPEYNIKFMWAFDANGNQYDGWPLDVSDHEDFSCGTAEFALNDEENPMYLLKIVEANS